MKQGWIKYLLYSCAVLIIGGVVLFLIQLGYSYSWTGFGEFTPTIPDTQRSKTLWDWMDLLIVPIVLGIGAFFLNRSERESDRQQAEKRALVEREIAADRQQENALQTYVDRMADLLLNEKLRTTENAEVRDLARTRTLSVLRGLDGNRKSLLFRFLVESELINKEMPVFSLFGANLSNANLDEADLSGINLQGVDLSNANLYKANLRGTNLLGVDLHETYLCGASLSNANLNKANLIRADLTHVQLISAKLNDTDLTGADLSNANLIGASLRKACLIGAKLNGADLTGVDLTGADLSKAKLNLADLSGADLSGASLSNANLSGARLHGAYLKGANLSGAVVTTAQLKVVETLIFAIMPNGSRHD